MVNECHIIIKYCVTGYKLPINQRALQPVGCKALWFGGCGLVSEDRLCHVSSSLKGMVQICLPLSLTVFCLFGFGKGFDPVVGVVSELIGVEGIYTARFGKHVTDKPFGISQMLIVMQFGEVVFLHIHGVEHYDRHPFRGYGAIACFVGEERKEQVVQVVFYDALSVGVACDAFASETASASGVFQRIEVDVFDFDVFAERL